MKKRLLSMILTVCMVLSLLPTAVFATSTDYGDFTVTTEDTAPIYDNEHKTLKFSSTGTYTIEMKSGGTQTTNDQIQVNSGGTVNITLKGVNINRINNSFAFEIDNNSVVNLTLEAGTTNRLAGGSGRAGLQVRSGSEVIIDGTGTLDASGGGTAAGANGKGSGIGTDAWSGHGAITINEGTIIAQGGYMSAGIGSTDSSKTNGKITISGGTVTATSESGAGIGGGYGVYSGEVVINGNANVTATANWEGAGIGSSAGGTCGTITIGGNAFVKAIGGVGAGIGGGGKSNSPGNPGAACGNIIIEDNATVTAVSNFGGAGIGGGSYSTSGGSITIGNNATVIAVAAGTKEALDSAATTINGTILMGNYSSPVDANTATTVKNGWGVDLASPITYTPTAEYKSIAFTVPGAADYTLYQGSARQKGTQSSVTSPTFIVGAGLNTFTSVTTDEPTYAATVTVNKDASPWSGSGKSLALYQGTTKKYNMTVSGATATVSAAAGTYDIYDGVSDTGLDISVSSGGGNAAGMNYYTLTLLAGAGTSSPTGSGVYLPGKSVAIDATVNTGYAWSKWTSSNTGLLVDQTEKSTSIVMPAGPVTLTATTTPALYNISYQLNGGIVGTANPTTYQYTDSSFTLNNPTRSGYSFLGWTGSNGTTAQTSVSIPTGSTGEKTYTANWKADKPSAPATSIVTAKTDTSLTITTQTGYEYSVDGTNWYSGTGSYTFTDLAPNTAHNLVCRKAAVSTGDISSASDVSEARSVSTKMASASVSVPAEPTVGTGTDKPTSNSITVSTVAGNEYYISTSSTADWSGTPNGHFKATENGMHKFDSLNPATQYYIHVRVAETDAAMPSASSNVSQYTLPETPAASVVTVNYTAETISFANTYEVSVSADFSSTISSGGVIQPGTPYYFRVKAASGAPASEAVSFAIPVRPAAPTVITADKTKNSITITTVAGQEYKINSGDWQVGGSFTDLSADTGYTVYTRVKATGTAFASADYSISVTTKSTGTLATPTLVAMTYDPTKKLSNITLPAGWAWSTPSTVPTATNTGYSAVYTPTDADAVDYSGVLGYANTSGTVTITRTIALTVNRATPTAADFTYAAPLSLDYSGTAKTATVTAKGDISGMGAVTVKYYLDGTETTPRNVGTYTVKIDTAQGDNYASTTAVTDSDWTFTIGKMAQAALSITNKPASITYGDTFTLATTGGSGTGAVTWAVTSGSSATVDANGAVIIIGVGETTITATRTADENHSDPVTYTYTFTPAKRLITVDAPSATGDWTKTYDGIAAFNLPSITVGSITNKVGADDLIVSAQSATYDTAAIGSGDKALTITYAIEGAASGNYSAPNNTVISDASITAATPTITLKSKTAACTGKIIEIDAATVKGVAAESDITSNYAGAITYTYYTKDTCTDGDKTTADNSGAEAIGGAPKNAGTYYVKATIAANGNYAEAASTVPTLTIYNPSSGGSTPPSGGSTTPAGAPVIVDGKPVNMGTSEVKDGTTTVKVDQNKMTEQLKSAKDSVVIPITSKTDTASAQLVVQNVESMTERGVSLSIIAGDVSYSIPSGAIDTSAALKALGASDSSKVPLIVTISKLSSDAVTIRNGTLMVPPVAFTVTATYNGKSVAVDRFASYVQRVIEIPEGTDRESITTAVVMEADGTQRHVPTEVYSENGKWYAKINAMTNSTYALIQNSVSFTDTTGKWYDASVTEMASREIISGIGENMFAGERAITRAEFAAIIVRAMGLPISGTSSFTDVASSAWYNGAVGTAFEYGIVSGVGDNNFNPDDNITRQDAMVIMERAGKMAGLNSGKTAIQGFLDLNEVASYALSAVNYNTAEGLVKGSDGKLNPKANITRAETATVVLRLLRNSALIDVRN